MPGSLKPLGALVLLLAGACGLMTQSQRLAAYDRDIEKATKAIETARDDGERATRHAERGAEASPTLTGQPWLTRPTRI